MADANIEQDEIRVYFKEESARSKKVIRAVNWIVDGKHWPQLEKREYFKTEDGWKMGKAKGFNAGDLRVIQREWNKIMEDLGVDTEAPAPEDAPRAAAPATATRREAPASNVSDEVDF